MSESWIRSSGWLAGSVAVIVLAAVGCGGSGTPPAQQADPGFGPEPAAQPQAAASDSRLEEAKQAIGKQDFAKARQLLESLGDKGGAEGAFYLGVALEGVGDAGAATAKYRLAIAQDPKLLEAYVNLSAVLLANGDGAGAAEIAAKGLKLQPANLDLLTNQALGLEAKGDWAGAAEAWKLAAAAAPEQPKFELARAQDLAQAGKEVDAVAVLERLGSGADQEIALAAADSFGKMGRFERCVAVIDAMVKAKPTAQALVRRGVCKHGQKDSKGAEADYRKALELEANYAPAHYYLGMALSLAKKNAEACKHLTFAAAGEGGVGKGAKAQLAKLGCK
jgi:tetratricopeptide (TPR) repeat protein